MSFNIKNGDELITIAGTPKVTRSSLELENVDNTADLDKPVSTATQAALDLKADITDLDKKANKTFIEAVDNTTSVVTVPEGTSFAAVGKICGKTIKDGEVLKSAQVKSVVSLGRNMANTIYGKTLNTTYGTEGDGDGAVTDYVEVDYRKTYYITGISTAPNSNCFYAWYDKDKNFIARNASAPRTYIGIAGLPANAKYIRANQYLSPSEYDTVKFMMSEDASTPYTPYNKTTVSLSEIVKNLPDYGCSVGNISNVLDLENMKYYHNVGDLKDRLTWNYVTSTSISGYAPYFMAQVSTDIAAIVGNVMLNPQNILCGLYNTVQRDETHFVDKTIVADGTVSSITQIQIKDSAYTTLDSFLTNIKGKSILYQRKTPEVIDLTSILYPFKVESGGTITFENEHNFDVQNTVLYKKEVL